MMKHSRMHACIRTVPTKRHLPPCLPAAAILLAAALLMAGCAIPPRPDAGSANSAQPSLPALPALPSYRAYHAYPAGDLRAMPRMTEPDIPDAVFSIGDMTVTGKYRMTHTLFGVRSAPAREYDTAYGTVTTDLATGIIVSVDFRRSETIDAGRQEPLSAGACDAIAQEFVSRVAPHVDWETESLVKSGFRTLGEGTSYEHNVFGYSYQRTIGDLGTHDHISLAITEYGSILYYRCGSWIFSEEVEALAIDTDKAQAAAERYAADMRKRIEDANRPVTDPALQFTLTPPSLGRIADGCYALFYGLIRTDSGGSSAYEVVVPLKDGGAAASGEDSA